MGTVHGAFSNCKKYLPGIFVEVDDYNVLQFLEEEVFGSGLYNNMIKLFIQYLFCSRKLNFGGKIYLLLFLNFLGCISDMAIRVVEFSNGGYKIRKIFA